MKVAIVKNVGIVDVTDYKRIYEEVWSHEEYRQVNHGLNLWREHRGLFPNFETVIDLGCGTGELVQYITRQGYEAYGIDIASNAVSENRMPILDERIMIGDLRDPFTINDLLAKSDDPEIAEIFEAGKIDLGVCCDVMEHIHEDDVPAVLANIWAVCEQVIFVIANHESNFLGYDLHPTKKAPGWWWRQMLAIDRTSRVDIKPFVRPGREWVFSVTWKRS